MNDTKVTMYTTTWCPDCHRAKAFLKDQGVSYDEIDIETTPKAAEVVMAANDGRQRVPTFEIAGRFYGNPPIVELRQLIAD